ncbi:low molecular weight phosphotyrosine protein phosphatase [Acinetobacter haemolyticus]|uniref:low molecular weight protein-tyrosine-phosphatase n=1 Tax=Acinetobacter haemolyticus TaxID=29430 RepID=UPI0009492F87|nr:low molecular weight protein-tyrosine-phosphatase [Acinetobacter haemolyticus]APR70177.1 protein-tyrosine-phosphatase [Acinetobacter haemolyticus]NAR49546.1 low molecular weight phosphotyrosine protein phosphatase [Acinetobacter haemolyticus]NAR58381.1 low molecular weight phosphotyrosine protein phosphatase [Acinetobacter haemolyticus]NAR78863.1 low molecular weight phosphotyrosine protein phosphatase [Acinetobacter haemolyticus]NAR86362.1 low molecular weight phosphotyrosine protein phosp
MPSKTPYKVLCVCLGNICRSPTAEVVFRHHCDEHGLNVIVDSAGTSNYHPNKAPDRRSQQHASQRGYDLSALRARQMILTDFIEFDLILAMDHENYHDIQSLMSEAITEFGAHKIRAKIALMSEHDPRYSQQAVPDPYYGGADGFERVLDQCESSSQAWVNILKEQMSVA